MAALVQTLPVQTATITMLGRPSSAGGYSPQNTGAYPPQSSQAQSRHFQANRYNNLSATGYRGLPPTGPVAPYAFTSTPQLANAKYRPAPASTGRSISAPKVSQVSQPSSQPTSPTMLPQIDAGSRLSIGLPIIPTTGSFMGPSQSPVTAKPSPDRYRRVGKRLEGESGPNRAATASALPSGSGMAAVGSLYSHPSQSSSTPSLSSQTSYRGSTYAPSGSKNSSADDLQLGRNQTQDLAARYRRRSLGNIETAGLIHSADPQETSSPHPNAFLGPQQPQNIQPVQYIQPAQQTQSAHGQGQRPSHSHTASSESRTSSRSGRSSRPGSVSA